MPNIINADDGSVSGIAGIKQTADSSGALILQANGVNAISISNTAVVTISSSISGNGAGLTNINASNISSGTVATARLASGTANSSTYLRGDSTWAALSAPNNGTLTMNTSGTGISGSATFTADQSGNSTFTVASNANSANGASTIVARDSSGNFTANAVTLTTGSFAGGSNTAPSITFTGDTNTGIFSPAADTIAFTEGGVESMRIDSSGNVGIGTASPLGLVDIVSSSGAVQRVRSSGTSGANTLYQNSNSGTTTADGVYVGYDGGAGYLWNFENQPVIFGTNNAERVRITETGNVGIGTTSIDSRLVSNYGTLTTINTSDIRTTTALLLTANDPTNTSSSHGVSLTFRPIIGRGAVAGITAFNDSTNKEGGSNLTFFTGSGVYPSTITERLRIASNGALGIGGANYGSSGQVLTSNGSGSAPSWGSVSVSGTAVAWVSFNDSGTIRASFNVSSIGVRGTGLWTVNFSSALADANYAMATSASPGPTMFNSGGTFCSFQFGPSQNFSAPTSTQAFIYTARGTFTGGDATLFNPYITSCVFFR